MNNPENLPIDTEEQRAWMLAHKAQLGLSWSRLAKKVGRPEGTLSAFGGGKYQGDNEEIARQIFRYRQTLNAQAQLDVEAPQIPGFIETPTAKRLLGLLAWAQRGRIVAAATGPGTSKTSSIAHYADSMAAVWVVTMKPSTAGVANMQMEVLAALGEPDACGTPQRLSRRIIDKIRQTSGLLVFDEAQHMSEKAIEEIRSWHDATGIGIALFGNHSVIGRLEGGSRKAAYAQLFSRIGMRHVQALPYEADALALADAWGIHDAKELQFVKSIAAKPGGLRGMTMMLEIATMLAGGEAEPRGLPHMEDAWAQLASLPTAA